MTKRVAALLLAFSLLAPAAQARSPYSDAELIDGFERTIFASEYASIFSRAYVRKFAGPVNLFIRNGHTEAAVEQVRAFVESLPGLIHGLELNVVDSADDSNFVVHVVRRRDYADTIRRRVFDSLSAPVRGRCMVRAVFSREGIERSDAVIVADEGEGLFSRCMTEEILQGLGPLNDDRSLEHSMFNDTSRFTSFRRFDRLLLNMLYDEALEPGMARSDALDLLPDVLGRVRARVEGDEDADVTPK